MTITLQALQNESAKKGFPRFKAGQTVRVYEHIREGDKARIQIFEGLIIQTGGQGSAANITVRKIIGGIGVEKNFAIHSQIVQKIELVKEAKTRRSKMLFMRERSGKSARLKEKFLTDKDLAAMAYDEASEEDVVEAVEAQKSEAEQEAAAATETTEAPAQEEKAEAPTEEEVVESPAPEAEEKKED